MIIAFIPARCGSKSIPYKNIKKINGKPLIYWSIKSLVDTNCMDKIVVATDCKEIAEVVDVLSFPQVECYHRDPENATDDATTESVMLEYLDKNRELHDDDIFILVQATSPLTESEHYINALKQLRETNSDSLLTCVRTKRFYWNESGKPINYNYMSRPRRQDFHGMLMENGAFYISNVGGIKLNKNRLSGKIEIFEMPEYTGVELDELDDWFMVEGLMKKYRSDSMRPIRRVKLFLTDVDGTLTDAGMYYDLSGNELKKFNTHDGKAFELLRNAGIKTGLITSEDTEIVNRRANKLKVNFLYQGLAHDGKLEAIKELCKMENISLDEIAYIGDDINCKSLLEHVGLAACPDNAIDKIKEIPGILKLKKSGGNGAVREFVDFILEFHI